MWSVITIMVSRNVKPTKPVAIHSNLKPSLGAILWRFMISMVSVIGFVWLILGVGDWLFDGKLLANTGLLGASLITLLCAFVSTLYVLIYLYIEIQKLEIDTTTASEALNKQGDKELTDTLMQDIETAYKEERWEEVLKIGSVLSRPLWVTGKYKLRVRLGKLTESAAAYGKHPNQQASALIDDVGWTRFALGDASEAKNNILHGIRIAEECGNSFLAYKGYRHLSGITMENGNLTEATSYHDKSIEYAQKLQEGSSKQEALAGLHVNEALLEMKRHNWDKALQELEASQTLYRSLDAISIVV